MLLGAVDLGSNSFRVEIGRLEGDSIHTQNYLKETVRLAGGFDDKGALTPEIQARALAAPHDLSMHRLLDKWHGSR